MKKKINKSCMEGDNKNIINLVNVNKDLALELERQSNIIVFLNNKRKNLT